MVRFAAAGIALWSVWAAFSAVAAEPVLLTGNEARAPKIFLDKGRPSGYLIEVMRYVERETGQAFEIELYPLVRASNLAKSGASGIIGFSKTTDRLKVYDFGQEPMFYDDVVIVVAAGKEFEFNRLEDLAGKTVGVARGASYGEDYDQAVRADIFTIQPGTHPANQLAMLRLGRLDAVLLSGGRVALAQTLATNEARALSGASLSMASYTVLTVPFARNPNYVAFAKIAHRKALLAQMDAALKKGWSNGDLQKVIDKYSATIAK